MLGTAISRGCSALGRACLVGQDQFPVTSSGHWKFRLGGWSGGT